MIPSSSAKEVVIAAGVSNREFLETHAAPGRIGLTGGVTLIDRAISRAERHVDAGQRWSAWTHAFLFEGRRIDGQQWLIESDLQVHRKHIRLGVQENRLSKYHNEELYTVLAVLDFGLEPEQIRQVLSEGLELVAARTRYSLREILGTWIAVRHHGLRERANPLARERSFYCSALVRHLYGKAGLDLAPGVDLKNTTPEDLARTTLPHTMYVLKRQVAQSKLKNLAKRVRARIRLAKRRRSGE